MNEELTNLSLVEVANAVISKKVSSVEVVKACVKRIEQLQSRLNCFISIDVDGALSEAEKADAELKQGKIRGKLHGVPLAHKDLFYRTGRICTCGSKIRKNFVPDHTATVLSMLEAEGALNLGTLHMCEFAYGPHGLSKQLGPCRNPWNTEYISGGSSSGSASAVAGRLIYGALGTDTGGSIRMPSGFCGVVGLKPTYSRVSRYGVMPVSFSLDTIGIMTRKVRDCARILSIIGGSDLNDPTASSLPIKDYEASLDRKIGRVRIGIPTNYFYDKCTDEIRQAMQNSLDVYRSLGAEVIPVEIPDPLVIDELRGILMDAEAATIHRHWLTTRPKDYSQEVRERIEPGLLVSATQYLEALNLRQLFVSKFVETVFGRVDILHTPLLSIPVPTIEEIENDTKKLKSEIIPILGRCTRPFSYLGLPTLIVPSGFTQNRLPVAFQLVGTPFSESKLLNLGYAYESENDWHLKAPIL